MLGKVIKNKLEEELTATPFPPRLYTEMQTRAIHMHLCCH